MHDQSIAQWMGVKGEQILLEIRHEIYFVENDQQISEPTINK
jgi:hypothetical protein